MGLFSTPSLRRLRHLPLSVSQHHQNQLHFSHLSPFPSPSPYKLVREMAGCPSSFGLSNALNVQDEVCMRSWKPMLHNYVGFKTLVREVTFHAWVRHVSVKNQRFLVWNSQTLSEQQSGVGKPMVVENEGVESVVGKDVKILEKGNELETDVGGSGGNRFDGSGGNGKYPSGGGGGGGSGGSGSGEDGEREDKGEEEEFGPIMKFDEVIKETEAQGASLPSDMLEAAKIVGIRRLLLLRYLDLQGSGLLGFAMKSCSMLRNRMLADPSFLFKIGTEIVIDSCCATFAEIQKRGKDFWAEFELYVADLLVGVVVNVALVSMLAPYARIGQPSVSKGFFGRLLHAYGSLPSSVFEAERPGCRYSVQQRIATYFYKGVLYGFVGFACGIIGQGIANLIMNAKRSIKKSEDDIPVPPLVKSAALWGVFLAVSSNTRYQIINGLERVVEASPLAKQVPPIAMAFTVGVRFANNVYGGMQFVDWARWSGVQ